MTLSKFSPCVECGYNHKDNQCTDTTKKYRTDHGCQVCNCADGWLYYNGVKK